MKNVVDAFQFDLDPTDASKLDVFNLRTGEIYDLENYKTVVSPHGINLIKNMNIDPFNMNATQISNLID